VPAAEGLEPWSNPGFETLLNIYDNADKENIAPK
jgi:hypothetical protein